MRSVFVLAWLIMSLLPAEAKTLPARVSAADDPPIQFRVVFKTEIDTALAKVGDPVEGYLREDLKQDDEIVAPAGSKVLGHIEELKRSRTLAASVAANHERFRRHGSVRLTFDEIVTPKKEHISIVGLADQQISIFNNHDLELFREITVGPEGELRKTENLDVIQVPELELSIPTSAVNFKGHLQVHIQPGDELKVQAHFADDDASSTAVSGKVMTGVH